VVAAGVDIIGLNCYRVDDYSSAVTDVKALTDLPMYFSEGGADSYDTNEGIEDQAKQAQAVVNIWNSIKDTDVLGITYMSWQDEWWKAGNPDTQDTGGASSAVPYDNYSNEEYWGWVKINGTPKLVLSEIAKLWASPIVTPTPPPTPTPTPTLEPTPTPTVEPTPTPTLEPTPTPTVEPTPTPTLEPTPTPTMEPTPTPTAEPTPTPVPLPGDLSGDGSCDIMDVVAICNHWGETNPTPGWIPEDLYKDGVIDIMDIVIVCNNWTG
jgi:hypothetical protein